MRAGGPSWIGGWLKQWLRGLDADAHAQVRTSHGLRRLPLWRRLRVMVPARERHDLAESRLSLKRTNVCRWERGEIVHHGGSSSSRTPRPDRKASRASATRRKNVGWCSRR